MPPSTLFRVDNVTGRVTVGNAALNYESVTTYTLTMRVSDKSGLAADATVTVSVLDDNDPPSLAPATLSIQENSPLNSACGPFGRPLPLRSTAFAR